MSIEGVKLSPKPFNIPKINAEVLVDIKKDFGQYLSSRPKGVQDVDRDTSLGKYLRTMRFFSSLYDLSKRFDSPVHMQGLLALVMQESKGDPLSRNLQNGGGSDGGAGLLHTQPDTGERIGLSLYSNKKGSFSKPVTGTAEFGDPKHPKKVRFTVTNYAQCDYDSLMKQGFTRAGAYKIHGAGLVQLKLDMSLDYQKLKQLDDRFDDIKNITSTMRYFNNAKKSIIRRAREGNIAISPHMLEMYILNSFNKGFGWKDKQGKRLNNPSFMRGGNHMSNLGANLNIYKKYNSIVENGVKEGLSYEQIYTKLTGNNNDLMLPKTTFLIKNKENKEIYKDSQQIRKIEENLIQPILDTKSKINTKSEEISQKCKLINEHYRMRVWDMTSAEGLVGLVISPSDNYRTKYTMTLGYEKGYWLLTAGNATMKIAEGSRYDISDVVVLIMTMMVKSFQYNPDSDKDDIMKGLFEYDGDVIEFNANNRLRDPNIINKEEMSDFIKSFPKEDHIKKLVLLMNEMYRINITGKVD